ncbi:MAG: hypothetical protein ACTS4X_01630 [Candidatus Hodgkinia cicadicola]
MKVVKQTKQSTVEHLTKRSITLNEIIYSFNEGNRTERAKEFRKIRLLNINLTKLGPPEFTTLRNA